MRKRWRSFLRWMWGCLLDEQRVVRAMLMSGHYFALNGGGPSRGSSGGEEFRMGFGILNECVEGRTLRVAAPLNLRVGGVRHVDSDAVRCIFRRCQGDIF